MTGIIGLNFCYVGHNHICLYGRLNFLYFSMVDILLTYFCMVDKIPLHF